MSSHISQESVDNLSAMSVSLSQLAALVKKTDTQEGMNFTATVALAKNRVPLYKSEVSQEISKVIQTLMEHRDFTQSLRLDMAKMLSHAMTMVLAIDETINAEHVNMMIDFPALDVRVNAEKLQLLTSNGVINMADYKKLYTALVTAEVMTRRKSTKFVEASALSYPVPISPEVNAFGDHELHESYELFSPFFIGNRMKFSPKLLPDLTVIRHAGAKVALNRYNSLVLLGKHTMEFALHFECNSAGESIITLGARKKMYLSDTALEEVAVSSGLFDVIKGSEQTLAYDSYADLVRAFIATMFKVYSSMCMHKMNQLFKWYGDGEVAHIHEAHESF